MLDLKLLGRPAICKNGQDLAAALPQKGIALLAWLAVTGRRASRAALAGLFWPDLDEDAARANLRLTLSRLRPAVGDLLAADRNDVTLDTSVPHTLDVAALEAALDGGRLSEAVDLYTGDFLEDFQVAGAPEFDVWAAQARERLHRRVIAALAALSARQAAAGELSAAAATLRRWVARARWDEEAHRRLIALLAHDGRRSEALAAYDACRRALSEELDVEPDVQTQALAAAIRRGEPVPVWWDASAHGAAGAHVHGTAVGLRSAPAPRPHPVRHAAGAVYHAPAGDYPLVGRMQEQRDLAALFARDDVRLVTLVGPGGVGKTRLALAFAAACPPDLAERSAVVWLAGLAPTADGDEIEQLLLSNIAQAIGLTFSAAKPPRAVLLAELAAQRLLLVLDNFEQVRAGAPLLVAMLEAAPALSLLVTSRVRLGLPQEWVYEVRGLEYPPSRDPQAPSVSGEPGRGAAHAPITAERLPETKFPAVALFVAVAQRVRPGYDGLGDAASIHAICRLVQGQPLGLVLAAQWARALHPGEIAARLESDIDLLATTGAEVDPRHRSLRAVWDSSWAQLTAIEQSALRRLSLFAGPFEAEAAEQVAGASLPVLAALVERSLLQRVGERFGLHALLRQYAAGQLRANASELQTARDALLAWYGALLRAQRPMLDGAADDATLERLGEELENLRAVWEIALAREDLAVAADYLEAMVSFLQKKGWLQEAVLMLTQAAQLPGAGAAQRARWERLQGECYWAMGLRFDAARHHEQALALLGRPTPASPVGRVAALAQGLCVQLAHQAGWRGGTGRALDGHAAETLCAASALLGQVHFFEGDQLRMAICGLRALNLAERHNLHDWRYVSYCISALTMGLAGRRRQAAGFRRKAHAAEPLCTNLALRGYATGALAAHLVGEGLWQEAERILLLSLEDNRQVRNERRCAEAMAVLGKMHYYVGRYDEALLWHTRLYESARARRSPSGMQWSVAGQAEVRIRCGGDPAGEVAALQAVVGFAEDYIDPAETVRMHGLLATCLLAAGDKQGALARARQGLGLMRGMRMTGFWAVEGYDGVTVTLLRLWEQARAAAPTAAETEMLAGEAAEAVRALARFARFFPAMRARADLRLGDWERARGRTRRAAAHYRNALERAQALGLPYERAVADAALRG